MSNFFINHTLLSPTTLTQWKQLPIGNGQTNEDLLVGNCDAQYCEIDLDNVSPNDHHEYSASWLKNNRQYIDFNRSFNNIHDSHNIGLTRTGIQNKTDVVSYGTLKSIITNLIHNLGDNTTRFDNASYEYYVFPTFNNYRIEFAVREDFTENEICFSIAFFRSLEFVRNINNSTILHFYENEYQNERIIYIRINGDSFFYDISDVPRFTEY